MTLANFNQQPERFAFKYCIDGYSITILCGLYYPVRTFLDILMKYILKIFDSSGKEAPSILPGIRCPCLHIRTNSLTVIYQLPMFSKYSINLNRLNTKISLKSMAVAAYIELTIGTYDFICSTWVLDLTDKSLIRYDPSMSHKNLCCTSLKRLYRTSSEQIVHGGVGKMVSFFF